jgi:hypothetical protein
MFLKLLIPKRFNIPRTIITVNKKTKGGILIVLGIIGMIFSIASMIIGELDGRGRFIAILISIYLIWEGSNIRKGKRSSIFDPPGYSR